MIFVFLKNCVNVNINVQGEENGHRIHNGEGTNNNIMPSGNFRENFYLKQVVIYLL